MRIIKALYGFAETTVDVTELLQKTPPSGLKVGKKLLKCDPVYGKRKQLVIEYETGGTVHTAKFSDGDTIRLKEAKAAPTLSELQVRASLPTHLGDVIQAKCTCENGYEGFLSDATVYDVIPNPNRTPRPEYFIVCDNGELRSIIQGRFEKL